MVWTTDGQFLTIRCFFSLIYEGICAIIIVRNERPDEKIYRVEIQEFIGLDVVLWNYVMLNIEVCYEVVRR